MKKKLLLLTLALSCVLCCACSNSKSNTETETNSKVESNEDVKFEENFKYTANEYEITITKYIGKDKTVEIPQTYNNKSIVKIGNKAFEGSDIEAVSLAYVKEVGNSAFKNCKNLKMVSIASIEYIGDYAFENCSSLKRLTIPPSFKSAGSGAFDGCDDLIMYKTETNQ